MAFKGTTKRPSAMDIASLIDGVGGECNAFTSKEITGYYVKAAASNVDLCLDVLSDMLQHSKFDQGEIDKEKGVILEEKNLYEDTPSRHIGDLYEILLYGDTPLGREIIGTKEVITGINRQDFVDYMQSLYSASNLTVVVAGGISTAEIEKKVEQYFGEMKSFDTIRHSKQLEDQIKPALFVQKKITEQVHVGLGFRTVSIHSEEKHALSVLSAILGGGMSSRLFSEVREKEDWLIMLEPVPSIMQTLGIWFQLQVWIRKELKREFPSSLMNMPRFQAQNRELQKKELDKAKEYLKGHFVLELEDSRSVAGYFAQAEILEKKIETPEEIIAKIDKITVEDVEAVAKKYFKEKQLNLAIIGNFDDRQRFEKLLKF